MVEPISLAIAGISGAGTVYAVIVSRRALHWQQARTQTHVVVEIGHGLGMRHPPLDFLHRPGTTIASFYEVEVAAVNQGETTEYIAAFALATPEGKTVVDYELPRHTELKPHAQSAERLDASALGADQSFIGTARLANGMTVRSTVQHLDPAILQRVED